MHAMRGISAHSNGFQTCRALHMLQLLLGSVEAPGGFRFKPPYPKPPHVHPKPAGRPDQVAPDTPLAGAPLGYVLGPEDLIIGDDGTPQRIDKAYSWDAPMSAHGMMHMVISNAVAGDPYPVDVLFMYMANMAWNSSMNTRGVMEMLTETDPETGAYKIPKLIYSDAYSSEMVAYADLVLPDTTYLERHDAISLLDRPICEAASPVSGRLPDSAAPMATPRGVVPRTATSLTPISPMARSGRPRFLPRHAISSRQMRPIRTLPSRWGSMTRLSPMPSRSMSKCCRNSASPQRAMATSNLPSIFVIGSGPALPRCQAGTHHSRAARSMNRPTRFTR
jgi:hypothetical protein